MTKPNKSLFTLAWLLSTTASYAQVITQFNFNTTVRDADVAIGTLSPSIGAGFFRAQRSASERRVRETNAEWRVSIFIRTQLATPL